jgi:hypothetical protein
MPADQLDIADLISVICSYRKEEHIFERHLALLTFGLWVFEPNDLTFVHHGRFIGAAQIVKSLPARPAAKQFKHKAFLAAEFAPETVAATLIAPPVIGPFNEELDFRSDNLNLAASIVETFLCAPPSRLTTKKPSLNKAIHFIANGGYGQTWKFSPATIKKQWIAYGATASFGLAQMYLNETKIIGIAPDSHDWFKTTSTLLRHTELLREYFGMAKYIQREFVSKLDPGSKQFSFASFPPQLSEIALELEVFEGEQLRLYQRYKAPSYSQN